MTHLEEEAIARFELSPQQKDFFNATSWIVRRDGYRSGRTYVLACAFIMEAMRNPGEYIQIWDHNAHFSARQRMLQLIVDISIKVDLFLDVNGTNFSIRFVDFGKSWGTVKLCPYCGKNHDIKVTCLECKNSIEL